jgi:hypothetical protein
MAELFSEIVDIQNINEEVTIKLDANNHTVTIGNGGNPGILIILDATLNEALRFDAETATLRLGTTETAGDISVRDAVDREVLRFDGASAELRIGNTTTKAT